jgi:tetratricopeptide (TPR) repeat protein
MGPLIRSASTEHAWLVALVVLLSAPAALADAPPAGSDAEQRAREYFREGRARHDAGAFAEAIVDYQAAYSLSARPELLFNIAQCYRLLGDSDRAILYYRQYLTVVPEGGASDDARAHIENLRRTAPPPGTDAAGEAGWPAWRWVGVSSVATGLVLVGLGVWQGIEAHHAGVELEEARGTFTADLADLERHGRNAERNMWILAGAGAVLVIAGGAACWLARDTERPRQIGAAPFVAPGAGGLVVFGSF